MNYDNCMEQDPEASLILKGQEDHSLLVMTTVGAGRGSKRVSASLLPPLVSSLSASSGHLHADLWLAWYFH